MGDDKELDTNKEPDEVLSQGLLVAVNGGLPGAEALEASVRDAGDEGLGAMPGGM